MDPVRLLGGMIIDILKKYSKHKSRLQIRLGLDDVSFAILKKFMSGEDDMILVTEEENGEKVNIISRVKT